MHSMNHRKIFHNIKKTLDLAPSSHHPTNKIAATLFGDDWDISHTNYWPASILSQIGDQTKVGNASGTVHAETACIIGAFPHPVEGASICITDPFCPNCAKNMAEAGIKTIYIDQAGFDKDFFKRRGGNFDKMSMRICEQAGIAVYALAMKEEEIIPILEISSDYTPKDDSPITEQLLPGHNEDVFSSLIKTASVKHKNRKFCIAIVKNEKGETFGLIARAHAVIGFSLQEDDQALTPPEPAGKYSFIQEPINRMIMFIARKGYKLIEGYFYCSQVPTSREQVNMVGAHIEQIKIGDKEKCRDEYGLQAIEQLQEQKILIVD